MRDILFVYTDNTHDQRREFLNGLGRELENNGYTIVDCISIEYALRIINSNARIGCVIYDWADYDMEKMQQIREINPQLPIFCLYGSREELDLSLDDFTINLSFLQYDKHLVREDCQRIMQAISDFKNELMPPFTKGLMNYVEENKYTFCTPGHLGGTAFAKSPVGALFYDFFGENIFKADISISIPELGSLLDHTGLHKDAEEYIAETFGADRSYMVTNGTSTANKIVGMFSAGDGDTILVDRNCHKSICHFMMMTNVTPIYFKPTRNAYGMLGGIPLSEFKREEIERKIATSPIPASWPTYAVVTNSTYDGLFYNVQHVAENVNVSNLHFDSAWVPYTPFDQIYQGKYGMSVNPQENQTIFETQSTHKLLAAFSQASMIHVRGKYDEEVLNETYMMHTTTSPFYPIVATCELSAAMMRGSCGHNLIKKSIDRAMSFRKEIKRLRAEAKDWYYDVWQPDEVGEAECWELKPGENWHGFTKQDADHNFLDPIKVTVLLPGIEDNKLVDKGIPSAIVSMFLDDHGIIVEKTTPYGMLFLFSIGIDKAKSMTLLKALNAFKQQYDENGLVKQILPNLYKKYPDYYSGMRIQELAQLMHDEYKKFDLPNMMYNAFDILPKMEMTPHMAYQRLIKGKTHTVKLRDLQDKISAVMVLPYPPGVPLIMPGERITSESKIILDYLLMLEEIGKSIPGFETDIHGVEKDSDDDYTIKIITE